MRTEIINKESNKNKKGYQSVKLYIPNDTLMGLRTKTFDYTNKERRRKILPACTHVLTNHLNELNNPVIHL